MLFVNGHNPAAPATWLTEKMNTDLADFQAKIKKLPKAMKDWDAFNDLRVMVDDLTAMVPLLEMMNNKAIQQRHWEQIMTLTKTTFNLDPDLFYLRNLMEAPLLPHREDIEEICISAVKEADIEKKLKVVVAEWEEKQFVFAPFKTRGNLTLKPSATSEIIAAMEDSLMTLSSLLSNRYNAPFKTTIQTWVQNLSSASEVIENWLQVQSLWIYLEAVFGRRLWGRIALFFFVALHVHMILISQLAVTLPSRCLKKLNDSRTLTSRGGMSRRVGIILLLYFLTCAFFKYIILLLAKLCRARTSTRM